MTMGSRISRRSMMRRSLAASAGMIVGGSIVNLRSADALASTSGSPIIHTGDGRVRGALVDGVNVFKGIPYGASPAGANRFLPPKRPEPWSGVREVLEFGPMAVQQPMADVTYRTVCRGAWPAALNETFKPLFGMSEDCLAVNVWTPHPGAGNKLPVMVWLHPGGFYGWAGNSDWTDGANLARQNDVVVVSLNHRVHVFGFLYLAHIGGPKYAESGNTGMLDIVEALKWVHHNIGEFGGDRDNVTIFGESGGANKVTMLMAMPAARGLFHKAIAQSDATIAGANEADAIEQTKFVMGRLNIKGHDAIGQLSNVGARDLRDACGNRYFGWPIVGSASFPRHPFYPDAAANLAAVPLLAGNTREESNFSLKISDDPEVALDTQSLQKILLKWGSPDTHDVDRWIETYRGIDPAATPNEMALGITTSFWRDEVFYAVEAKLRHDDAPVYLYSFDWGAPGFDGRYGAAHTFDIPFVFNNVDKATQLLAPSSDHRPYKLAAKVSGAWAAFARTGNPSHPGLPDWKPYTLKERATMQLNYTCSLVTDPYRESRKAFETFRTHNPIYPIRLRINRGDG